MARCSLCNYKTSILLQCKLCFLNKFCTKCIQYEVHKCSNVNKYKLELQNILKIKLNNEASSLNKILEI
jgi:hypothetical protein